MSDTILIRFDWDSGPFGVYGEAAPGTPIDRAGDVPVVPVPREVWERYTKATAELYEAEEALDEARRIAIDS